MWTEVDYVSSRRNALSSFISKETEVGNGYRRNAPNCEKEGVIMTMWTRYCREQAQRDYHKSQMLKILLLRAMYETDK
jgi:hypothetical protein